MPNSIESLKKLKTMLDLFCVQSDAIIDSYEKHGDKLKELTNLAEQSGDTKTADKLKKLQKIDIRAAKKILCMFSSHNK
jgi:DNA-binding ferritin-like protein